MICITFAGAYLTLHLLANPPPLMHQQKSTKGNLAKRMPTHNRGTIVPITFKVNFMPTLG